MSDVDDLPDLIDSSDDEKDRPIKQGVDHADVWLRKPEKFLKQQEHWMKVFCLSPFLYGLNNILPIFWTRALVNAQLVLSVERLSSIEYLTWEELECVDLMEVVIVQLQKLMRDKQLLGNIIDLMVSLDGNKSLFTGVIIDVELSLKEAEKQENIRKLWRKILKNEESHRKEKPSKFAVLYVLRMYVEHVLYLSRDSKNFVDEISKSKPKRTGLSAEDLKEKGNKCFQANNYDGAIDFYSQSCKKDPHNHIYYGNRAQAYLKLDNKMMYALADGRRAITIKPEFPKGHYRYALAFFKLGRLDSAIAVNQRGLMLCQNTEQEKRNMEQLSTQRDQYLDERNKRDREKTLTPMPASLGKTLDSMNSSKPGPDLNEKFNCNVPKKEASTVKKDSLPYPIPVSDGLPNGLDAALVPPTVNHEEEAKKKKEEDKKDFLKHLTEGSDLMSKHIAKEGMTSYHKALDMLQLVNGPEYFDLDESDLVTLKYAYGTAAVETGQYKHIMEGIEKFNDIIENHVDVRFPLAYYGLGKAFVVLNRFSEALHPISNGIQAASRVKYSDVTWPGTQQRIAENESKVLVSLLKDLQQLCRCPPPPDAVCRFHSVEAAGDDRTVIYLTDPDFKGYTKMMCQMNCVLFFHPVCWKEFKSGQNKHADKEMFETQCPTPDCPGLVMKLEIMRPDAVKKEYLSDKHTSMKEAMKNKKSIPKQKTTSEVNIAKKQEKKEQRKQRRRQRLEETDDLKEDEKNCKEVQSNGMETSEDTTQPATPSSDQPVEQQLSAMSKETTILRKEDLSVPKTSSGKSKRSKKKKDKGKQVLSLEVNFNDRKEGTLLNENSVLSDEEQEALNQRNTIAAPFTVPAELKTEITQFEKTYKGPQKPLFKPDGITENLFSFFVEILKANGPLEITDEKIQQELEVFPVEALEKIKQTGGLADFLRQSLKFAVIDNIVSLMCDAKKARDIALSKRNAGQGPSIQNAWQTVGKGVQNVDSLSESVTVPGNGSISSIQKTMSFSSVTGISVAASSFSSLSKSSTPEPSFASLSSTSLASPIKGGGGNIKVSPSNSTYSGGGGTRMNTLDSIDDFPIETSSKTSHSGIDDLDDFETVSDTGSGYSGSVPGVKPVSQKLDAVRSTETMSRSSSRSDVSDSSRSDFSSGMMPKPLRPVGEGYTAKKSTQMWDKLESDFDSSFSKVSNEGSDIEKETQFESVGKELQKATDDFVRKNDETFVVEIAQSVVDKMIRENGFAVDKRTEMLEKVSKDIWKDFEKSANSVKLRSGGMWANTPVSDEYSKNVFVDDFMKRHYMSSEPSNFSALYPSSSYIDSGGDVPYKIPSASPWSNGTDSPFLNNTDNPSSMFPGTSNSSSLSMFSGLSWGSEYSPKTNTTDSFSLPPPTSTPLTLPQKNQPFIRPPPAATNFYNISTRFPPPLRMPLQRAPMPPQMTMMATGMATSDKKDKETQYDVNCKDAECMTDPYEPFKMEYLQIAEERDRLSNILDSNKSQYDKLSKDYMENEMTRKSLEMQLKRNTNMFEQQTQEWQRLGEKYNQEQKQLHSMIVMKDSSEKQLTEKIEMLQTQLHEQARQVQEQRERDTEEKRRLVEHHQQLANSQLNRAKAAEVEVLRVKMKADTGRIGNTVKDATMRQQHLGHFIKKHNEENRPIPSQLQQQFDFMKSLVEKLEGNLAKLKSDYAAQISEIQAGKLLSELQRVKVPSPPPIPDVLKSAIAQPGLMPRVTSSMPSRPFGIPALPNPPSLTNGTVTNSSPQNVPTTSPVQPPGLSAPKPVTPRPLTHPNIAPLRPLAGVRAPLALPNRPPLRPLSGLTRTQPMTSFDKLVLKLEKTFPSRSRSDFPQLIQELRNNNNGSLSGMTLDNIVAQIGDMIANSERKTSQPQMDGSQRPINPPPGLSSWAFLAAGPNNGSGATTRNIELFQEEEDPCVICHEEMTDKPAVTLECCHTFHDECIRKWFQEQSTCPNCRVHTLLSDDFPSLGKM